jgi:putative colanic acid biosysnthesis UDP-glucose lipid carrier transferase
MSGFAIRATRAWWPHVHRVADGVVIALTLWVAQALLNQPTHDRSWSVAGLAVIVYFIVGEMMGLYRPTRSRTPDAELVSTLAAWSTVMVILIGLGFATRISESFARSSVVAWFLLSSVGLMLGRMISRIIAETCARRGIGIRSAAIAGMNELGLRVASNALLHPECGLKIIGFYDDREPERLTLPSEGQAAFRGNINDMLALAKAGEIDTILVTLPMRAEKRIQSIMDELSDSTASVYIVPDFFVFELLHSRWAEIGGLPVVSVFESPLYGVDGILKRLMDSILAAIGIVCLSPVLLVCAILVRLSSPGPILFRQKRYGLDGREILVWKFRSMRTCDNGPIVKQATKDDPRVTPIGKILRRTSLDELPQLFNVLAGTMSLVGPRPHANAHNEHFRRLIRGYMLRHKVKPGITGLAQVEGSRGETDTVEKMQQRIELDHRYIRDWSLWLDIKIMFKTLWVVFAKEAY